jgi:predicted metal-binding membrane protein
VAAAAWVGVARQAGAMGAAAAMDSGSGMGLPAGPGTVAEAAAFTAAWGVMMAAMMLPSAAPMVALYGAVSRTRGRAGPPALPTAGFAATYLLVWVLVGLPVYAASVAVGSLAAASPEAGRWLPYALAGVLVGASAYQFSALKRVCLRACQSPLAFLMARWRSGSAATLRLGLAHAAYCLGCCWARMVILVAAGAMSLPWVLLIAAVVAAEKLLPRGEWITRGAGGLLLLLGAAVAVRPELAVALRGGPMPTPMPMPM